MAHSKLQELQHDWTMSAPLFPAIVNSFQKRSIAKPIVWRKKTSEKPLLYKLTDFVQPPNCNAKKAQLALFQVVVFWCCVLSVINTLLMFLQLQSPGSPRLVGIISLCNSTSGSTWASFKHLYSIDSVSSKHDMGSMPYQPLRLPFWSLVFIFYGCTI